MNSLLEQLHDIDGIDAISRWPLAIGWWVLIGLAIVMIILAVSFVISRIRFKRSWKYDTFKKLAILEENLTDITARQTVMTLSEYIRRIVLRRFPRKECAGLVGKAWLKWLAKHDPKEFDWETKGAVLIEGPYSPIHQQLPPDQIKELIKAIRHWVR